MPGAPRIGVVTTRIGIPSEIWALRQARAFRRVTPVLMGWSVDPAGGLPDDLETRLIDGGFAPPAGPLRRLARKAGLAWALTPSRAQAAAIRTALADTDAALCHFAWTAMAVQAAMPAGYPVIWHVHGRDVSAQLRHRAYRALLRRRLPRAAALVAVGRHQLDRLAPFGLPARRALIPCGAPLALFAERPLPAQSAGGPVRFVSVGRLSHEKGMMETLAAFERVAADLPAAELVLIGYGPLADALAARAAASPAAARIRLTGALPPAAIAAELAAAHVYLQHSRAVAGWVEGFGVTLTEAGAAGLPLLASASGGLCDQVEEGVNGHLFPPGDVDAQAGLMLALARDPARRARMGAAARDLAARFDSDAMAARLEAEIVAVLGLPDSAAPAPAPASAPVPSSPSGATP